MTRDVVVVGCGIAGLSAALAAAEAGARVTVVERATERESGGNTRYTEAFLRMASTEKPAEDLEDRLLGDHMGHPDPGVLFDAANDRGSWSAPMRTLDVADGDVVGRLAVEAGPTLQWLTGHGLRFDALPTPFLTTSTTRLAPVGGGEELVKTLTRRAHELGVSFRYETTARSLVLDDDGQVTGLRTSAGVLPGRVVLACGGFEGNPEMLARYLGASALNTRPVARGGHYNKGEGIEMALAVGAAGAGNFSLFHAEPIDPRSGRPEAAIFAFPYGILVNTDGDRFTDEAPGPIDAWYERVTRRIHAQTDGLAWMVLDQRGAAVPNLAVGIRTDQPAITAPTLEELAARIEVPAGALVDTVATFNAACPDETGFDHSSPDGLATTGLTPGKSNWSRPLVVGPFVAYPVIAANVFTFGGLRTDADAHVVDRSGGVLEGLYAAGEITGMYYTNYTGSTSVLRGAVFGRVAGSNAAAGG
jgi:tricarballylate dehydrogenase